MSKIGGVNFKFVLIDDGLFFVKVEGDIVIFMLNEGKVEVIDGKVEEGISRIGLVEVNVLVEILNKLGWKINVM